MSGQPQVDLDAIEAAYLDRLSPENKAFESARLAKLLPEAKAREIPGLATLTDQEITAANQRIAAARARLPPVADGAGNGAGAGNGTASSPLISPAPVAPAKNKTFTLKVFVTPDQNTMIKVKEQLRDAEEDEEFNTSIPLTKSKLTGSIDSNSLSAIKFAVGATGQQPVESAAPNAAASSRFSMPSMSGLFGSTKKQGGSKKKRRKSTKRRGKTARR
jgi:hypothetical protein